MTSPILDPEDIWFFAYGSLMWDPAFPYVHREAATVHGYHRGFCVYSWVYRGTEQHPGLVLGLDRGGSCQGIAFRIASADRETVIATLDAREMVTAVYHPIEITARLASGATVRARSYAADRTHVQYAGRLSIPEEAAIIRAAHGKSGANMDYVRNTLSHLQETGIHDHRLYALGRTLGF